MMIKEMTDVEIDIKIILMIDLGVDKDTSLVADHLDQN